MKSPAIRILPLLLAFFLLGACGQKGPLYLPGSQNDPNVDQAAETTEAQDEDDESGDDDGQSTE